MDNNYKENLEDEKLSLLTRLLPKRFTKTKVNKIKIELDDVRNALSNIQERATAQQNPQLEEKIIKKHNSPGKGRG